MIHLWLGLSSFSGRSLLDLRFDVLLLKADDNVYRWMVIDGAVTPFR